MKKSKPPVPRPRRSSVPAGPGFGPGAGLRVPLGRRLALLLALMVCGGAGPRAGEGSAEAEPRTEETAPGPRLERHRVPTSHFQTAKPLLVYLPPDYDPNPAEPYPVVYFLHGLGNSPEDFESRGAAALTDRLIREGRVPPVIVALPSGAVSYYVNRIDGGAPYEDHVRLEAPSYVEARYPVRTDPTGRAISGISMGGYGALKIAMRYPGEFGSASAHTPFLMDDVPEGEGTDRNSRMFMQVMRTLYGDPIDTQMWAANNPFDLAEQPGVSFPPLMLTAASEDRFGLQVPAAAFHQHLNGLGVPHVFVPFEGLHGWQSFESHWESMLSFHAKQWSASAAAFAPSAGTP